MKKLLYTTSALVGAAFLMEAVVPAKAEVNISMRYRAALLSQSQKDANKDNDIDPSVETGSDLSKHNHANANSDPRNVGTTYSLKDDGEKDRATQLHSSKINIDITASKDHPNGLTTGASLAIATSDKKLDYDNAIGYVSGSFGKFEVGDFHDVGYRALGYGTPGTGNFGAVDAGFQPSNTPAINTSATGNVGGRASSIAYWSPSFSGAQVSVSWSPQVSREGKAVSYKSKFGEIEDSVGLAATYSGSFGGTGVSMGVSYETAKVASGSVLPYADITNDDDNDHVATTVTGTDLLARQLESLVDPVTILINKDGTTLNPKNSVGTIDSSGNATDITVSKKNQDPSAFAGYVSFDIGQFSVGGSYGAWESDATNADVTSEHTAYALGASYSVDAITFGIGWAGASTDNTHHNIRVHNDFSATGSGATVAQINASSAYKQTLDRSIVAFTTNYQLGDGAALDFVIEQGTHEKMIAPTKGKTGTNGTPIGKEEIKSSGFGIGIDLKF